MVSLLHSDAEFLSHFCSRNGGVVHTVPLHLHELLDLLGETGIVGKLPICFDIIA